MYRGKYVTVSASDATRLCLFKKCLYRWRSTKVRACSLGDIPGRVHVRRRLPGRPDLRLFLPFTIPFHRHTLRFQSAWVLNKILHSRFGPSLINSPYFWLAYFIDLWFLAPIEGSDRQKSYKNTKLYHIVQIMVRSVYDINIIRSQCWTWGEGAQGDGDPLLFLLFLCILIFFTWLGGMVQTNTCNNFSSIVVYHSWHTSK